MMAKYAKWFGIGSVSFLILVIGLVVVGCSGGESPATTKAIAPPSSPTSTIAPVPTSTPTSTIAPVPTSKPMTRGFAGKGDRVVGPFSLVEGIVFLTASHSGAGNFIVKFVGAKGGEDYSINAIGPYIGARAHSIYTGKLGGLPPDQYRLNITADGPWSIDVSQEFPSTGTAPPFLTQGRGDDVITWLNLDKGIFLITAKHTGSSNFIVALINENGSSKKFVVNEIGDYTGEQLVKVERGTFGLNLSPGIYAIVVQADGEWTVTVKQ